MTNVIDELGLKVYYLETFCYLRVSAMSASTGGMLEVETFFTKVQKPFPKLSPDGKIETLKFLESAKGVAVLAEHFGALFIPVKNDLLGNIEKLSHKYKDDQKKYFYLNDMILSEREDGECIAIDALLWLRRGLDFFHTFYSYLLESTEAGNTSEDMRPILRKAYEETLEPYHLWMSKLLFKAICQMCPSRKDVVLTLTLGEENQEKTALLHLSSFLIDLKANIQAIYDLYKSNGIDLEKKA